MALVWEDKIWLSNGAQVPIKDIILDSVTGRILRVTSQDDRQKDSTDPYRYINSTTTDITDILTFDERNALRSMAKSYDIGSKAPARGVSPVGFAIIGSIVVLGIVYFATRKGKNVS
jgi:hypothetical protein